ncbi:hypothetical protein Desaci_0922 [Desulfosporosinus acidiphilus SJ4]|uniref:Uncharacterized protein n=1 Tax=Desulfosporosinus acidiphilus (strain DSM 22704 / JCM 16185 / SJ4) TaxID=646529 RepID=I4D2E4_DESAJ|nr:hypothetical protein [Desulfosporosinus acidiphilus]AFM39968.1 hypothetical protein Desaci_0922 [Desulfosporosinus acidiphilus SJ4]
MNRPENKGIQVAVHPEFRRTLLSNPTSESLRTIFDCQVLDKIFERPEQSQAEEIIRLLPYWEQQACQGNQLIATLICCLAKHFPNLFIDNKFLKSNVLRIRILSETPGIISFPSAEVQEHLLKFLLTADVLADLPQFEVISFSLNELQPLSSDLAKFCLSPHSHRYIQNLFYPERCEAILSVLAYIAKNYPLLRIAQQAYALMLSLDDFDTWGNHPFCLRLIANRFWDHQAIEC